MFAEQFIFPTQCKDDSDGHCKRYFIYSEFTLASKLLEIWRKGEWKMIKCITQFDSLFPNLLKLISSVSNQQNTVSVQPLGKDLRLE